MRITTVLLFASLCTIGASAPGQAKREITPGQGRALVLESLSLRIPTKVNSDSEGNANGIPG